MNKLNTKPTVYVGIPAFNEEANIGFLLKDLTMQDTSKFKLEKILVISDGSTDKTTIVAKKINNKLIEVEENKKRLGLAATENTIIKSSNSDILVILNADIMIKSDTYIEKLIEPIMNGEAKLTCAKVSELESSTFVGKVIGTSMEFKRSAFEKYNNGNNIYTCHGLARAFEKKLYKKLYFKESIGEDSYSYLFTIKNQYNYSYVSTVKTFYKSPTSFKDHKLQSIRFTQSKKKYIREFGKESVNESYQIPKLIFIKTTFIFLFTKPIYMGTYLIIYTLLKLKSLLVPEINDMWEISKSSKNLRGETT